MTSYVKVIFKDPSLDEHGYRIEDYKTSIFIGNGTLQIVYLLDEPDEKFHCATYDFNDVFSVLVDEE